MGQRGRKSQFVQIACPNKQCRSFGRKGEGNIKGNGRYQTQSGLVRKFICHTCGGVFCERSGTAFYDLRSPEDKVLLALKLVLRGMALRAVAGALEVKLDTVRFWLAQAAAHAEKVNEALVRDVHVERVELDELWTFVRKKTSAPGRRRDGRGWPGLGLDYPCGRREADPCRGAGPAHGTEGTTAQSRAAPGTRAPLRLSGQATGGTASGLRHPPRGLR